jgi:enoyl-CoA hydratase/carnithine racemase
MILHEVHFAGAWSRESGSGWAMLSWDPRDKRLINAWVADHTTTLAAGQPILVLDMYEHAHQMDYGAKAGDYVRGLHAGDPLGQRRQSLRTTRPQLIGSGSKASKREAKMAVVETERHGQVLVVRMNRPERLNALSHEMRTRLAEAWTEFRRDSQLEVAIFTGTGRAFCAGEDMKESLQHGAPGGRRPAIEDPFMSGALEKPVIAAVNGYAMGGGFMLVERTDLRVAARGAVFEVSEAKRWLLGGYNHGHVANLPYPIAMEMALGFRFTAERFYEIGFLNRLVDADQLIPSALAMAEHLLTLPPASRVNTVHMMRQMRPVPSAEQQRLAAALHEHGAKGDLIESRAAFAEKRQPRFKGWDDPEDRYRLPSLEGSRN